MRITSAKRVVVEDYPSASHEIVQRLAQTLNNFLDQVNIAFGANITIGDNLKAQVFPQFLMAGSSTFKVNWTLNERPTDIRIAQLSRPDASIPTAAFSLHWSYANGVVSCTILGLDPTKAHNINLIGQV